MGCGVIRQILYGALMWGVTIYAFRRGGREERIAAVGIVVASYATPLALISMPTRFHRVEVPLALLDACLAVLLLYLALRSNKFWPLWLTAMQCLTIFSHFALLVPHMLPWSYWNAAVVWSYPMWIVLAIAIRRHHRAQSNETPLQNLKRRGP
jgi:hypothetical protein